MKYLIGIDCGGTKIEAEAYDLSGSLIQKETTGFGNLLINEQKALFNIKKAISALLRSLGQTDCVALILGVAGIDSGGFHEKINEALVEFKRPIILMNDGELAHYAILKGKDGMTVTAGTGSVILGSYQNCWYRVGGWGHLLGDEGSAYVIAKQAIQEVLLEYDLGQSPSFFSEKVLSFYDVPTVFELTKKIYSLEKGAIAALASVVAEYAEEDPIAKSILSEAGKSLANDVKKMIHKLPIKVDSHLIGINGSVIEKNRIVRESFIEELNKEPMNYELKNKEGSCAKGAYYFYQKNGE